MFDQFAPPDSTTFAAERSEQQWVLASRGQRLLGAVIDSLPFGAFVVYAGALPDDNDPSLPTYLAGALAFMVGLLVLNLVQWVLITRRGQTIGKMLTGTRIIQTPSGGAVGFKDGVVIRQWVMRLVSGVTNGIAEFIDALMVFRADHRCMHDHFAGTIVVDASYDPAIHSPPAPADAH